MRSQTASRARARANASKHLKVPFQDRDQTELPMEPVDMKVYYDWLAKRLDAKTIKKIKKINSREGFEAYMKDMKLEFEIFVNSA